MKAKVVVRIAKSRRGRERMRRGGRTSVESRGLGIVVDGRRMLPFQRSGGEDIIKHDMKRRCLSF